MTQPELEGDEEQVLTSGQKSPLTQDAESDDDDTISAKGTTAEPTDNTMMEGRGG